MLVALLQLACALPPSTLVDGSFLPHLRWRTTVTEAYGVYRDAANQQPCLLVTSINAGFTAMYTLWSARLKALGLKHLVVVQAPELHTIGDELQITFATNVSAESNKFRSPSFNSVSKNKIRIIYNLMARMQELERIWLCDPDILFFHDPYEVMKVHLTNASADATFMANGAEWTGVRRATELRGTHYEGNTGFYVVRNTAITRAVWRDWERADDAKLDDQTVFWNFLRPSGPISVSLFSSARFRHGQRGLDSNAVCSEVLVYHLNFVRTLQQKFAKMQQVTARRRELCGASTLPKCMTAACADARVTVQRAAAAEATARAEAKAERKSHKSHHDHGSDLRDHDHGAKRMPPVITSPLRLPAEAHSASALWIDVGIGPMSEFEPSTHGERPTPFLVAIEAAGSYASQFRRRFTNRTDRATLIQAACTAEPEPSKLPFYVHAFEECNSLHSTTPDHPLHMNGKCVGLPPTKWMVNTVTLRSLLADLPRATTVQVLKVDVQGHEWPCIEGARAELARVDNIFIELQDVAPGCSMYVSADALNVSQWDARMRPLSFERQYCEVNTAQFSEMNCLYTRTGKRPLWLTGRPQRHKGSMLYENVAAPPPFTTPPHYVQDYERGVHKGALYDHMRAFGPNITWGATSHAVACPARHRARPSVPRAPRG